MVLNSHRPSSLDLPELGNRRVDVVLVCPDPSNFRTRRLAALVEDELPPSLHCAVVDSYEDARAQVSNGEPSVCLVDDSLGLRGVAGVVHRLRDENRRCACVVLSEDPDLELRSRYLGMGARDVLLWQEALAPDLGLYHFYRVLRSALRAAWVEWESFELRRRFEFLTRKSPAPYFRVEAGGHVLDCNQQFAELLGYLEPAELIGSPLLEMQSTAAGLEALAVEPGDVQKNAAPRDDVVAEPVSLAASNPADRARVRPFRGEPSKTPRRCCLRTKDGSSLVVELSESAAPGFHPDVAAMIELGNPHYALPVFEGFVLASGPKELELRDELQRYEAIYNSLFSAMAEGFVIADARGRINAMNPSAEATLGVRLREVHGRHIDQILRPVWCDEPRTRYFSEIYDGRVRTFSLRADLGEGFREPCWVRCKASLIRVPGAVSAIRRSQFLISVIDIRAQIEAERGAEQATLGTQVAVGVSHDMRNYLTAIASSASLMRRMLASHAGTIEPSLLDYAEQVEDVALSSAGLLDQVVRVARPEAGSERSAVELSAVVKGLTRLLDSMMPKQIDLQVRTDDTAAMVLATKRGFEQLVINLVLNARQALAEQPADEQHEGRVVVSAETTVLAPDNSFGVEPGPAVVLTVADNGPGMSPAVQRRMYDPFYTSRAEGSGLGLSMVRELVEQFEGTIHCDSRIGQGTTFTMAFPSCSDGPVSGLTPIVDPAAGGDQRAS